MHKVQEMSNNFSNDINPFHVYEKRSPAARNADDDDNVVVPTRSAGSGGGGGSGGGAKFA